MNTSRSQYVQVAPRGLRPHRCRPPAPPCRELRRYYCRSPAPRLPDTAAGSLILSRNLPRHPAPAKVEAQLALQAGDRRYLEEQGSRDDCTIRKEYTTINNIYYQERIDIILREARLRDLVSLGALLGLFARESGPGHVASELRARRHGRWRIRAMLFVRADPAHIPFRELLG